MTQTQNEIFIRAPAARIFELASRTERWPEILPHYRSVRVVAGDARRRTVEMAAWRDFLPVRWTAVQHNDAQRLHIAFHHTAGWTKGMDVEWLFEERDGGTRVQIVHELEFEFPFFAAFLGRHVVGNFFVHDIARKTLARMKALAEDA